MLFVNKKIVDIVVVKFIFLVCKDILWIRWDKFEDKFKNIFFSDNIVFFEIFIIVWYLEVMFIIYLEFDIDFWGLFW